MASGALPSPRAPTRHTSMSLFGPVPQPLLDETTTPVVRRALQRARIVGNFATVQALVQLVGFASGILIVRRFNQSEYAVLHHLEHNAGDDQRACRHGDQHRPPLNRRTGLARPQPIRTAPDHCSEVPTPTRTDRYRCCYSGDVLVAVRNGASIPYATILVTAILLGLLVQFSIGVITVVPRLRSDISLIQRIDLTGAIGRLIILVRAFLFLNAGVAVTVSSIAFLIQYAMLRKYAPA